MKLRKLAPALLLAAALFPGSLAAQGDGIAASGMLLANTAMF